MPTTLRALLLTTLAFTLSGCGTFIGRAGEASNGDYYKGVAADMVLLGAAGGGGSGSGEADGATVMCYLMVVCPLITLVSVPLDAALDTLLLPFDLLAAENEPQRSAANVAANTSADGLVAE